MPKKQLNKLALNKLASFYLHAAFVYDYSDYLILFLSSLTGNERQFHNILFECAISADQNLRIIFLTSLNVFYMISYE